MITRSEVLSFLGYTISVLSDIKRILAIVPDYKTLLHHVSMFRDFLEKEYTKQN